MTGDRSTRRTRRVSLPGRWVSWLLGVRITDRDQPDLVLGTFVVHLGPYHCEQDEESAGERAVIRLWVVGYLIAIRGGLVFVEKVAGLGRRTSKTEKCIRRTPQPSGLSRGADSAVETGSEATSASGLIVDGALATSGLSSQDYRRFTWAVPLGR
ncbi:hypothetical protein BDN72DRAFT_859606 [Pluteus cervinus]|uniref:Uncharacterized protein n=1 Tax=Pluteus cervinus TaxID=181527 RepID=A0ACD3ALM7_9AGAR|nr:hypothetical protein BDN72DRAFT_859606 [Pluteus cervinus]